MATEAVDFEVTKMGEKGQIVIPQPFREQQGLKAGDKFIVMNSGDALILKRLHAPSKKDLKSMLDIGHEHAKKHKITEKDMWDVIKTVRSK